MLQTKDVCGRLRLLLHVGCETHHTLGKTWVLSVAPTLSEDVGVPPLLPRLSRRVSMLPLRQRLLLWIEY